ncbi:MAG: MOSC N-terminal beta barrel domain-containing protein [Bacteroidota bacterium]
MHVSELFIYPVKSLLGIAVDQAEVRERGFVGDRRWMIVDKRNVALTQRTHPILSQISVDLDNDGIHLSYNGSSIRLTETTSVGKHIEVEIWGDKVTAITASASQNRWISEIVGDPCQFVFMSETAVRRVSMKYARNDEEVSFADGAPYLLIGQSSLADLNDRLEIPVPMNRFRPNIVIAGSEAYEEDTWQDFNIGGVSFYGTHTCKRCVFTTVDQETGIRGKEPVKTLSTYRKQGNQIAFGLNVNSIGTGKVQIGDSLTITSFFAI